MKRQGATNQMMSIIFNTIEQMQHYIRTSFGDSDISYQQTNIPFHGILQGNGAGPTIWAMISSTLLDRLRDKGHGVTIDTQDGRVITIPAFAFVDDTDVIQELIDEDDIISPQNAVNEWSGSLQTTGGLIIGDKFSFQVVKHQFENNQWKIDNERDERIEITIPNQNGESVQVIQNNPNKGEMALGIAFSPTGDHTDEIRYLRDKTTSWAEKIKKSKMTHVEAWTALKTTIF